MRGIRSRATSLVAGADVIAVGTLALLVVLLATLSVPAHGAVIVVVGEARLWPQQVTASAGHPVVFVNRSGSSLHLEFMSAPKEYRILHVNGSVSAIALRPGRHPFVVRFAEDPRRHLHGVVDAQNSPTPDDTDDMDLCVGSPPARICIER